MKKRLKHMRRFYGWLKNRLAFLRSANRADTGAASAADAGRFVDFHLAVNFADRANRAFTGASTAADTFILVDSVSHNFPPKLNLV